MHLRIRALLSVSFLVVVCAGFAESAQLKVVTTLTSYASIARHVGGDRVQVASISRHFVKPKPSLALMLRDADLFVTTGLDLEIWAPTLVDKSGNRRIRDGQPGFVAASEGVRMLDVPASATRSAGDIHVYGNPHIHTSPINAKVIAANIARGLTRVDPAGATAYEKNLVTFRRRIDVALYGERLVELLGAETLDALAKKGTLIEFLKDQTYEDRPLIEELGGWLGRATDLRGKKLIAYHKNWSYFAELFGLEIVDYVEVKPGIPPSARHVHRLIDEIEQQGIGVLLSATYFDAGKPRVIAERTGCKVVRVPLGSGGDEAPDYLRLIDLWLDGLAAGFGDGD
jgi:ABC-type Zn uptake system ZnuABC Zn-binding protein ZnuA